MAEPFIERRILTGLIISTEYVQRIRKVWSTNLLEAQTAKRIAGWCIEFFDKYEKAPGTDIESILRRKAKALKEDEIEYIEDILESLSDEFEREDKFNVAYLCDQTVQYFEEKNLQSLVADITDELEEGKIEEAKKVMEEFRALASITSTDLDLSSPSVLDAIEQAFTTVHQPVVKYVNQLGDFWNEQLVRGGFVALMAPEKRGKTFWLLDIAMRAARQRSNVAFFQAGDMTEEQQLKRIAVYLTKKSDREKYAGEMYEPIRDCYKNQLDECTLKDRECDYGAFDDKTESFVREEVTLEDLIDRLKECKDYKPCHNCKKYWKERWGAVWLKKVNTGVPLTAKSAKRAIRKNFIENNQRFKLSSHANRTLTVTEIESILTRWEKEENFIADVIIVDYADIMAPEIGADFRHQENDKWMRLRGLSQKKHALVVTVTQTDASSYEQDTLSLRNFSEDKRKFAHVTAMYGLNQDTNGREKAIGIMRINEIVVREDAFSKDTQVRVLQNLKRGQPCLESFW